MDWWNAVVKFAGDMKDVWWLITGVVAVILAVRKWIMRPLLEIHNKINEMDKKLDSLDEDTADIIGDRLQESHDFYVYQQKWCPSSEKARLEDMVHKYHRKGRNHLSDRYLEEIIILPEHPEKEG